MQRNRKAVRGLVQRETRHLDGKEAQELPQALLPFQSVQVPSVHDARDEAAASRFQLPDRAAAPTGESSRDPNVPPQHVGGIAGGERLQSLLAFAIRHPYQRSLPGSPLKGPVISGVIQPP